MMFTSAPAETRETVYAAIELSKKTWVLGIAAPDRDRPSIHRISGGNIAELVSRLRVAAKNNRRILVCYEDGVIPARRFRFRETRRILGRDGATSHQTGGPPCTTSVLTFR
jgi:hypothetical protein